MIRTLAALVIAARLASPVAAQSPLTDFVGTYADAPGHTLEIVAGDVLFAVLDDAKYKLRRVLGDVFLNGGGDTIPFRRDAAGAVTGYVEKGVLRLRVSREVSAASAALAWPRPPGSGDPASYRYAVPRDRRDGIPVGNVAATDLDTATVQAIVRGVLDGTYIDLHSILILQRGRLVLEEYFYGYSATRTHQMRSATKSLVSALAGIAIGQNAMPNANVFVAPRLTYESLENPDPRKSQITLAHLLTMSTGLACNDYDTNSPGRETALYENPDWVKATLDLPMLADPGSVAHYCSGGVAVVGRTIEKAVHTTLPAFAQTHLFSPLGIPQTHWTWNYTLTNANKEYSQIHLRPRDMLKFGMLYANGGLWNGRRVIPAAWVTASMAEQVQLDGTGYGYFWWRPYLNVETAAGTQRVYVHAAQGNGGQKIYVVPELDLVAVFTGGDYNAGGTPPNKIMARIILPRLLMARAQR
jgi:CubicO group peptidase (beta-lactamase class C family)